MSLESVVMVTDHTSEVRFAFHHCSVISDDITTWSIQFANLDIRILSRICERFYVPANSWVRTMSNCLWVHIVSTFILFRNVQPHCSRGQRVWLLIMDSNLYLLMVVSSGRLTEEMRNSYRYLREGFSGKYLLLFCPSWSCTIICCINWFTSLCKNLFNLLEFLAEAFQCHVHHFQCLCVEFLNWLLKVKIFIIYPKLIQLLNLQKEKISEDCHI